MKTAILAIALAALTILCSVADIAGEPKDKRARHGALSTPANLSSMTLRAIQTTLIDGTNASWQEMQEFLPLHEKQLREQIALVEIKQKLSEKGLISKLEVANSERTLANMRSDTEGVREWSAGDERTLSLTEESADKKTKRSVRSARRRHHARAGLIRSDGAASWSLDDVKKIELFFRNRFGRPLPVSALGQSLTHDRLGLDHSDAVDVAVRPDSAEGRGLMAYLRGVGIPFIAFRGKISRMSTGAHIHIGPPSPRLIVAKHHLTPAAEPAVAAERS